MRFGKQRPPYSELPSDLQAEVCAVRKPDFGMARKGPKVTWLGHAGFLIEAGAPHLMNPSSTANGEVTDGHESRGVRILADAVFSERTSPVTWIGPKRYLPAPCTVEDLPEVDVVITSHDHYDHLDLHTIQSIYDRGRREGRNITFIAGLGTKSWYVSLGIPESQVREVDWWDGVEVSVGEAKVKIWCTPTQHFSGRSIWNRDGTLWCSYYIEEMPEEGTGRAQKIFFAGDTGYRSPPPHAPSYESWDHTKIPDRKSSDESDLPTCPGFRLIKQVLGPPDLALLPIGLCNPRNFMAPVHCNPFDSLDVHKDLGSKRSVGMHWGTVRGGLSGQYEDVRWPPRTWMAGAQERGLRVRDRKDEEAGWEVGLLEVGETLLVD